MKHNNNELNTMVYGKVPPQAIDLEEAVLGAILLEREAYYKAAEILKPEAFYVSANQVVFKAMVALARKSRPIDILTVTEELRSMGELETVGGPYYVTKLTNNVVSGANVATHAQIVNEKYTRREVIRLSGELLNNAYDETIPLEEITAKAETELVPALQETFEQEGQEINAVLVQAVQEIEALRHRDHFLTGIPTGFPELDRLTNGWQNSDMIVIAARPACGKTAFMLNLMLAAVKAGYPAVVFSLEMSAVQLVKRLLAMESDLFLGKITAARMSDSDMQQLFNRGIQPLSQFGIIIDDKASLTVYNFKARLKKYRKKYKVKIAFGDYLQLMKGSGKKGQNREQEISEISREIKIAAKEENIPVIALSQLSREVEKRKTSKTVSAPQTSDLRESGAIEQDADMIGMLYNPNSEDEIKEDADKGNETNFKIVKFRNGALEELSFDFNRPVQRFTEKGIYRATATVAPMQPKGNWVPVSQAKPNLYIQPMTPTGTDDQDPF